MRNVMTWFDATRHTDLATNIQRAADYYRSKRGEFPDLCYVHPDTLRDNPVTLPGIVVMPDEQVYRSQLWVGMVDQINAESTEAVQP